MNISKEAYWKRKAEREAAKQAKEFEKQKAKSRTPEEIQGEYVKLCGLAGDKQYRIKAFEAELIQINERLYNLNQEFDKARTLQAVKEQTQAPNAPTKPEAVLESGTSEQTC